MLSIVRVTFNLKLWRQISRQCWGSVYLFLFIKLRTTFKRMVTLHSKCTSKVSHSYLKDHHECVKKFLPKVILYHMQLKININHDSFIFCHLDTQMYNAYKISYHSWCINFYIYFTMKTSLCLLRFIKF